MEETDFIELVRQLSARVQLVCVANDHCITVSPLDDGVIWTSELNRIISFCRDNNLYFFIDFKNRLLCISNL